MKAVHSSLRWFLVGMGQVMGISHSLPPPQTGISEIEAIGGDFRAVGNDLRYVIKKYPAREETERAIDQSTRQLELVGIS
jgi:hypothetical protein